MNDFDLPSRYREVMRRIDQLEAAIRKHRDQRGDDRCWLDDEELYKTLPEGYTPPKRDSSVELKMCEKFIHCRHNPATTYVSPQRRIEELESLIPAAKDLQIAAEKFFNDESDENKRHLARKIDPVYDIIKALDQKNV
jgi:hypothetical protein